jgi:hypothetical protein
MLTISYHPSSHQYIILSMTHYTKYFRIASALLMIVVVCLFFSCSPEDDFTETEQILSLQSQMDAPLTRATADNTWNGGEQVKVSINDGEGALFTAAPNGTFTPVTPLFWQAQTISARAWYPATWSMKSNQSTVGNYQAADFIFAPTVSGITLANHAENGKKLTFSHQMAKVTANLTAGEGVSSIADATVRFYGYTSGTPNTNAGSIAGSANAWITPLKSGNSHTALLIPQEMKGKQFIHINTGGYDYYYIPSGTEATLTVGKAYTYNVTVSKTGLTVSLTNGSSWEAGGVYAVVGTEVPQVTFTLANCTATSMTVKYTDNTQQQTVTISNGTANVPYTATKDKIIRSIKLDNDANEILIGRLEYGEIKLKFNGAKTLVFRDAVAGSIPIGSYAEFQLIRTSTTTLSGKYRQETNLDLMDELWTPIGASGNSFQGTFDGDIFTLSRLKVNTPNSYAGLFGSIFRATLSNVHIISGSVSSEKSYVGGVCGNNENSTITACHFAGSVTGSNYVGGVCGANNKTSNSSEDAIIIACCFTGTVSGTDYVGGVCGTNSRSKITACYNTGNVSATGSCGGVCETNDRGTVTACYNAGTVTSKNSNAGSLCRKNDDGTITTCYYTGATGISSGSGDAKKFGSGVWPTSTLSQWGIGDGSGSNKYWGSLGSWNGGTPAYPRLWWE